MMGFLARFFCPRGRGFGLSFCPRIGNTPFQKIPRGFAQGRWSGLALTDTIDVLLMGIKPSCSNQLTVVMPLLKDCLQGTTKHLSVFLTPNITRYLQVSWRKILDFTCESLNIFLQLTNKYDIRCEEDQ